MEQSGLFSQFDPRVLISGFALLISIASFGFAFFWNLKNQKYAEFSKRLAKFNAKQGAREQLLSWASESMDELSRAYVLCQHGKDHDERLMIMSSLTSLIDKGRWLLPNHEHEHFGKNKESAFTGFRQGPLDDLVVAYNTLDNIPSLPNSIAAEGLMKCKRRFSSAVQEKLDPRNVNADLDELTGGSNEQTIR
ncbi:hypothetical protein MUY35_01590 [Aliiroseovarius sp. S1339]|uniref:hypothetical protein n=1 Tax=Aliiroseovarius sp. S1339 TaxID=2936990 RepID=UPI0020BEE987|nr:hypothetical protein [Aliiroseovarius sp. S1339]MCK8462541.1 hypothetical protein [Aliiroseovarius sp. S1339]